MTDNNHPITPPPELVRQWMEATRSNDCIGAYPPDYEYLVAVQAAQWGYEQRGADIEAKLQKARDEELEACCKALDDIWDQEDVVTLNDFLRGLRAARRPKPPSLAKKALEELSVIRSNFKTAMNNNLADEHICRALERLQELEGQADD